VGWRGNGLRRGRIKDIKLYGEWGRAGVQFGSEREKSDLRQQHIIRCRNGTTSTATARRWTENGRVGRPPGRQSSYRATEWNLGRQRKGNRLDRLHARSPPGAHDHFAERLLTHQAWGWALAACHWVRGRALQERRTLPTASRPWEYAANQAVCVQAHPAVRAKYLIPSRATSFARWRQPAAPTTNAVPYFLTYPGPRHSRMRFTVESGEHFSTQASSVSSRHDCGKWQASSTPARSQTSSKSVKTPTLVRRHRTTASPSWSNKHIIALLCGVARSGRE
jgi:hypothetical protein